MMVSDKDDRGVGWGEGGRFGMAINIIRLVIARHGIAWKHSLTVGEQLFPDAKSSMLLTQFVETKHCRSVVLQSYHG